MDSLFGSLGNVFGGLLSLIWLIIVIWAIVKVAKSGASTLAKVIWVLVLIFFPLPLIVMGLAPAVVTYIPTYLLGNVNERVGGVVMIVPTVALGIVVKPLWLYIEHYSNMSDWPCFEQLYDFWEDECLDRVKKIPSSEQLASFLVALSASLFGGLVSKAPFEVKAELGKQFSPVWDGKAQAPPAGVELSLERATAWLEDVVKYYRAQVAAKPDELLGYLCYVNEDGNGFGEGPVICGIAGAASKAVPMGGGSTRAARAVATVRDGPPRPCCSRCRQREQHVRARSRLRCGRLRGPHAHLARIARVPGTRVSFISLYFSSTVARSLAACSAPVAAHEARRRGAARLDGEAAREDGLGRARRAVGREAYNCYTFVQVARGAPHVERFQKHARADRRPAAVAGRPQRQALRDAHVEPPQGKFRGL